MGENVIRLPDIEKVAALAHEAWMQTKRSQGITCRYAEDGEDLMVPYEHLSERAKDLDRGTVKGVYAAIVAALASDSVSPPSLEMEAVLADFDALAARIDAVCEAEVVSLPSSPLRLLKKGDGIWLSVEAPSGNRALVHLSSKSAIVQSTLAEVAESAASPSVPEGGEQP